MGKQKTSMDPDGLRGAAVALTGVAAYIAAETTGSKTARKVATWASEKLGVDDEES